MKELLLITTYDALQALLILPSTKVLQLKCQKSRAWPRNYVQLLLSAPQTGAGQAALCVRKPTDASDVIRQAIRRC